MAGLAQQRFAIGLILLGLLLWLSESALPQRAADSAAPVVRLAQLDGAIGPATAAHIQRAIALSSESGAGALIIEMDTPGGLDAAMRDINSAILASDTPVIVFVHPAGARAASAGAYILYASHLAAMAPGTTIGAATPVQMGGAGAEPSPPDAPEGTDPALEGAAGEAAGDTPAPAAGNAQALRNKAVNDAVAYIRALAELRGRNADWAESAVRDAVSVTADEALALGVIEIEAGSLEDLLVQADGRVVTLRDGTELTLTLAGASIETIEKTFAEEALSVITDPNIAFLLVNLGFIGLLVSFYNGLEPVTGVAGLICLIVGFYALNTLPVNYAGAALIVLGLGLLVAEAFFASSGLLALGGLAAFILGALMLMDTEAPSFQIDWRLILATAVTLGASIVAVMSYGLAAQTRKVTTGAKGLIGQTGRVLDWQDGRGHVLVDGEHWSAVSKDPLSVGDAITVVRIDGLTLHVRAA